MERGNSSRVEGGRDGNEGGREGGMEWKGMGKKERERGRREGDRDPIPPEIVGVVLVHALRVPVLQRLRQHRTSHSGCVGAMEGCYLRHNLLCPAHRRQLRIRHLQTLHG
eukprot:3908003-Rhodomonas_salina.1